MSILRLKKFITGVGHAGLMIALVSAVAGRLNHDSWDRLELTFAVISLLCLGLTVFRLRDYLNSLEDRMTLRLLFVPTALGMILSAIAFVAAESSAMVALSLVGYFGWMLLAVRVERELRLGYFRFFRGHLPKSVWLNPPASSLQEGDAILVHGRMADFVRESMGHTETVVRGRDGVLYAFSALIEAGTVWRPVAELLEDWHRDGYDYIVLRLNKPLTAEQSRDAVSIAEEMLEKNRAWTAAAQKRLTTMVSNLPISRVAKEKLLKRWMPTGYDTIGKYWGGLREGRWTCIAVNIYLMKRLGVKMGEYGTGMFGLFGEFNPILPIRIMRDPAYRWLSSSDQEAAKPHA